MQQTPPLEIERKYLIAMPPRALLEQLCTRRIDMVQTYLRGTGGERAVRVRQSTCGGVTRWRFNDKRAVTELTRIEHERELTREEYEAYLQQADPALRPIEKTRWCVPFAGHTLEIDVFSFWDDRAFCEVELSAENEAVLLPEWMQVVRDVSGDRRYLNSALAAETPDEPLE